MAVPVIMPRQGQSVESCILIEWLKKKGDHVAQGDILFTYETDKATFEEEAKDEGVLLDIFCEEGEEIPVLTTIAVLGNEGEDISGFHTRDREIKPPVSAVVEKAQPAEYTGTVSTAETPSPEIIPVRDSHAVKISPRARKSAEKHGVDISGIQGTGPGGRIIERDIERHAMQGAGEYETEKISNIRKIIARNMHASLQNTAQLTLHASADARKLLSIRKEIKTRMADGTVPNITINVLVCFAVIRALQNHKDINAHFLQDEIRYFNTVHLGIAIDTDRGLMVPTVKNAETLNLQDLTGSIHALMERCKSGSIDPELLHGATFTVTNLGVFGIEMFTPIINPPQVGVLGVNTITTQPRIAEDGSVEYVPCIGLSLTFDHRAIDGAPAAKFLHDVSENIRHIDIEILRSAV
jgi:pyruvate dehydrogenase E2 component (dihydrolipoamide acetyltransferase)